MLEEKEVDLNVQKLKHIELRATNILSKLIHYHIDQVVNHFEVDTNASKDELDKISDVASVSMGCYDQSNEMDHTEIR